MRAHVLSIDMINLRSQRFLLVALVLSLPLHALAQFSAPKADTAFSLNTGSDTPAKESLIKTKVVVDELPDNPQQIRIGLEYTIEPNWYIYTDKPEIGMPTLVEWNLPEGLVAGPTTYPPHHKFDEVLKNAEYVDSVTLWKTLTLTKPLTAPLELTYTSTWQVCNDVCLQHGVTNTYTLTVLPELSTATSDPATTESTFAPISSEGSNNSMLWLLLSAFLGGIILNIMPCVLPVIGIKVMSFVEHASESPKRLRSLGWAYTLGVIVSFLGIAAIVIITQQVLKQDLGQGFQLQNLPFVILMTCLMFVMGMSMLGVFSLSVDSRLTNPTQQLAQKHGLGGAFFNGLLATLLSTPCSGPFIAGAMGAAFTQTPLNQILLFVTLGAGLAAPFLLLTYRPDWLKLIPKPGMWMERFKQIMGFLMIFTSIAGLYIIRAFRGADGVVNMVLLLALLGFACWLIGAFHGPANEPRSRLITKVLVLAIVITCWLGILEDKVEWRNDTYVLPTASDPKSHDGPIDWVPFKNGGLDTALESDKVIFVDATADWCGNCKTIEAFVLHTDEIIPLLSAEDVIAVQADWTLKGSEILAYLKKFGRAGVPMYVVYGKDRNRPVLLPAAPTKSMVQEAIEQAQLSFQAE